jgi:polysaccharide deacetylase 2 family uncharacterized protein YibQ
MDIPQTDQNQNQNQNGNSSGWIWIAVIAIVVVITLIAVIKNDSEDEVLPNNNATQDDQKSGDQMNDDTDLQTLENFIGTLQSSDNPAIGNLMLVQEDRNVYLFTSRDYSELLGQEVELKVEGSLERFRLVDIVLHE